MYKKILQTLVLLDFLWAPTSVMSGAPGGAEPWKDNEGRVAPARVRKAADNLWDAVEAEGAAAFKADWGIKAEGTWDRGLGRVCCALLSCCITECCRGDENIGKFGHWYIVGTPAARSANQAIYDERKRNVQTALQAFKEEVNGSVVKPMGYSGDANVCVLGPWIQDGVGRNHDGTVVSARRDLSGVIASVLQFVNAQGGWAAEGGRVGEVSAPRAVEAAQAVVANAPKAVVANAKDNTVNTPLLSSQH